MIDYFRQLPAHARAVALALLAVLALILLYVLVALAGWFIDSNRQLQQLEPRIARLQGYTLSEDTLRASAQAVQDNLSDLAYPAADDTATTGAAVQQQLRRHLETAGFSVSGSQLLAAQAHEGGFEELRVDLSGVGSMEALDQVLLELQNARPLLLLRGLSMSPVRTRRGDGTQTLNVEFSVSAVRLL